MQDQFPEKYIEYGNFVLHSGWRSNARYDVQSMLKDPAWYSYIMERIPSSPHYVGIKTGGAQLAWESHLRNPGSLVSFIEKDGHLNGIWPFGDYLLIDDVVITERSFEGAIKIIEKKPKEMWAVMDRRIWRRLPINFVFLPCPAWLSFE